MSKDQVQGVCSAVTVFLKGKIWVLGGESQYIEAGGWVLHHSHSMQIGCLSLQIYQYLAQVIEDCLGAPLKVACFSRSVDSLLPNGL